MVKYGFRWLGAIVATLLSIVGVRPSLATNAAIETTPRLSQNNCFFPGEYARVSTRNTPLNVRETPGGPVIGSIPRGWEVVVQTQSGNWAYVTHHSGAGRRSFPSAPYFRDGWVSMDYLTFLGAYCNKPSQGGRPIRSQGYNPTAQPQTAMQERSVQLSQDWTQLGDRISQSLSDSPDDDA